MIVRADTREDVAYALCETIEKEKNMMPTDDRWEKGSIAITSAPLTVKLERKGRLLVAVPTKDISPLTSDTVERTRSTLRKERAGTST
jgi:hypothetical protein